MILALKILGFTAIGWLLLWWLVPKGNLLAEGLRFPFWLLRIKMMAKRAPGPDKISYGKHPRQYFLYHRPGKGAPEKKHVAIYIHGSGWQFGRPEMFLANAQWLTSQGYHTFFLSHRRIPRCDIRELRQDTSSAIQSVLKIMQQQGLADMKILLFGNSSGGNLSALAVFDRQLLASVGLSPAIVSAVALFSAPLDLNVMWNSPPLLMVTRWRDPSVFRLANPIDYLEEALDIPVLLIHGEKDGVVEPMNSVVFTEKLKRQGFEKLQFSTLKGGTHLDGASWCFSNHPCCQIFSNWLQTIENQ